MPSNFKSFLRRWSRRFDECAFGAHEAVCELLTREFSVPRTRRSHLMVWKIAHGRAGVNGLYYLCTHFLYFDNTQLPRRGAPETGWVRLNIAAAVSLPAKCPAREQSWVCGRGEPSGPEAAKGAVLSHAAHFEPVLNRPWVMSAKRGVIPDQRSGANAES